jgi:hypothetical protein
MEQSSSQEANRSPATQNTCCILWNPNVHSRVHNSTTPAPMVSQTNLVHGLPSCFWIFVILSSHLRLGLQRSLFREGCYIAQILWKADNPENINFYRRSKNPIFKKLSSLLKRINIWAIKTILSLAFWQLKYFVCNKQESFLEICFCFSCKTRFVGCPLVIKFGPMLIFTLRVL